MRLCGPAGVGGALALRVDVQTDFGEGWYRSGVGMRLGQLGEGGRGAPRYGTGALCSYCSPAAGGGSFAAAGTSADYHCSWTTLWPESTVKT